MPSSWWTSAVLVALSVNLVAIVRVFTRLEQEFKSLKESQALSREQFGVQLAAIMLRFDRLVDEFNELRVAFAAQLGLDVEVRGLRVRIHEMANRVTVQSEQIGTLQRTTERRSSERRSSDEL